MHTADAKPSSGPLLAALMLLWSAGVAVGLASVWRYESDEGSIGQTPQAWPSESGLKLAADAPTVLLFAHPRCPCTRASLHELDRLMRDADATATVVFWQPDAAGPDWRDSELIRLANDLPRLTAVLDPDGRETDRFGAQTSGVCLAYDPRGRLRFRGGVTAGRGHEGPTRAQQIVAALFAAPGEGSGAEQFPVFGCAIRGGD